MSNLVTPILIVPAVAAFILVCLGLGLLASHLVGGHPLYGVILGGLVGGAFGHIVGRVVGRRYLLVVVNRRDGSV